MYMSLLLSFTKLFSPYMLLIFYCFKISTKQTLHKMLILYKFTINKKAITLQLRLHDNEHDAQSQAHSSCIRPS